MLILTYGFCISVRKLNFPKVDTKLTLRLDDSVIERAKVYARHHKVSLSKMVEVYFDSLTKEKTSQDMDSITPLVESLGGVIDLPAGFDEKKSYRDYLENKYE